MLLTGIPRNKFHDGGRLRFGPDGKLYAGTGDGQNGANAQNKQSLGGKVLRLNTDGSAPTDNPFFRRAATPGTCGPTATATCRASRSTGRARLWQAEFGDSNMDELNLSQKGGNYGWPSVRAPPATAPVPSRRSRRGRLPALRQSGIAIVNNALYVASLRGARLYRLVISGTSVGSQTTHFQGTYGRLRTVEPAPDGSLWLTTTNGDKDSTPNNSSTKILRVQLN